MNALINFIGQQRERFNAAGNPLIPLPAFTVYRNPFVFCNPMTLELQDALCRRKLQAELLRGGSSCHSMNGLFPHINPGELFCLSRYRQRTHHALGLPSAARAWAIWRASGDDFFRAVGSASHRRCFEKWGFSLNRKFIWQERYREHGFVKKKAPKRLGSPLELDVTRGKRSSYHSGTRRSSTMKLKAQLTGWQKRWTALRRRTAGSGNQRGHYRLRRYAALSRYLSETLVPAINIHSTE